MDEFLCCVSCSRDGELRGGWLEEWSSLWNGGSRPFGLGILPMIFVLGEYGIGTLARLLDRLLADAVGYHGLETRVT